MSRCDPPQSHIRWNKFLLILPAGLLTFFFQNCSGRLQAKFSAASSGTGYCLTHSSDPVCSVQPEAQCSFNGQIVTDGEAVTAYLNSAVQFGQVCPKESRTCQDGVLSGSFSFSSCEPGQPAACLFNGQTIQNGQSVKAFLRSSVTFGGTCVDETRVCENGVLSGTYSFGACALGEPASCLFDGRTIAHGQSISAFEASTVPYGNMCISQVRTCYNGALSGLGDFASCVVGQPAACLFNGMTIAHNQSVIAYSHSNVPYGQICAPISRTCDNGMLSGAANFAVCQIDGPAACLINGITVPHDSSINLYFHTSAPINGHCSSESRICNNGTLSGSAVYGNCTQAAFSLNTTRTRFHILWLEPLLLRATRGALNSMGVTSNEVRLMVQKYKQLGFYTLVIAYTEYADYFMYRPGAFSYYSKDLQQNIDSAEPSRNLGVLKDGGDFLSVFMDEAKNQQLNVILGLGRTGDLNLVIDMATKANGGSVAEPSGNTIAERIARVNQASRDLAHDLYLKFANNPAFGGWYLAHETHCLDQGMALYKPVASYLKSLTPSKDIMISPPANATSCNVENSLLQIVEENKNLINIYAYQDAIGAGTRFINGISSYEFTDEARNNTTNELIPIFNNLKLIHAQTGTFFWINTEAWRMDGPVYGNSYPGAWFNVQSQIDKWAALSPYKGNLMLNEGFLMFDFGIENAKLRSSSDQQKADQFTRDYMLYLQ